MSQGAERARKVVDRNRTLSEAELLRRAKTNLLTSLEAALADSEFRSENERRVFYEHLSKGVPEFVRHRVLMFKNNRANPPS